jgi:hypothetical protein
MSWAPSGRRWQAFRARMFGPDGWGAAPDCFLCGHRIAPGLGEIQHQVPPAVRPDLAYDGRNVRPVHGGGRKRCPTCRLACNPIAASNVAPRDAQGRPVPWDEAFIAAARKRTEGTGRSSTGKDRRGSPPKPAEVPGSPAKPRVYPAAGRPW